LKRRISSIIVRFSETLRAAKEILEREKADHDKQVGAGPSAGVGAGAEAEETGDRERLASMQGSFTPHVILLE